MVIVCGDIRDITPLAEAMVACDAVIHLACISNDPSFELDESLSRTINLEAFEPLVLAAKEVGVRRFVYCSTSSVYGVSDSPNVREDHPLVPLTLYNRYKGECEPLLLRHASDNFVCTIIRPSTICGYSLRQRLDLAVNILTNLAYNTGVITVYGGAQRRPNLHIDDMVDCYRLLLSAPEERIQREIFNVGARNATIMELAELVRDLVEEFRAENLAEEQDQLVKIKVEPIQDERSYQVNSDKIADVLGFRPRFTVADAVRDLCNAFYDGWLPRPMEDDNYYNVRRMRTVWEEVYRNAPPSEFDPSRGHLSEIDLQRIRGDTGAV
jgi:nucleoside-diphosphate-sugar epimerase